MLNWLVDLNVSPRRRRQFAALLLVVSIIAWPVTAVTIFRTEPQGILGLSYLSLIFTALVLLVTTDIREQNSNGS